MGDVLLTTPLLRQIATQYPAIRLDMIVDERFSEAIRHNPHLHHVFPYQRSAGRTVYQKFCQNIRSALPKGQYDLVIDLQRNRRSAFLRRQLGAFATVLHKQRLNKLALVYLGWNRYPKVQSIVQRYQNAASPLHLEEDGKGLEFWLPEEQFLPYPFAGNRPPALTTGHICIAIAPGAHHTTKRWLPERFAAAALQIAHNLAPTVTINFSVLGGTADHEICQLVINALGNHYKVTDHSGSASLEQTVRALDTASILLCNDTGIMHLAAARKIPIVAIFGSTVQEFGFIPYRVPSRIIEMSRADVPCRPCTHIGRSSCPKRHFDCMYRIPVDNVVQAALQLLHR